MLLYVVAQVLVLGYGTKAMIEACGAFRNRGLMKRKRFMPTKKGGRNGIFADRAGTAQGRIQHVALEPRKCWNMWAC